MLPGRCIHSLGNYCRIMILKHFRVKNYRYVSRAQNHLSYVVILHANKEHTDDIDLNEAAKDFKNSSY